MFQACRPLPHVHTHLDPGARTTCTQVSRSLSHAQTPPWHSPPMHVYHVLWPPRRPTAPAVDLHVSTTSHTSHVTLRHTRRLTREHRPSRTHTLSTQNVHTQHTQHIPLCPSAHTHLSGTWDTHVRTFARVETRTSFLTVAAVPWAPFATFLCPVQRNSHGHLTARAHSFPALQTTEPG